MTVGLPTYSISIGWALSPPWRTRGGPYCSREPAPGCPSRYPAPLPKLSVMEALLWVPDIPG